MHWPRAVQRRARCGRLSATATCSAVPLRLASAPAAAATPGSGGGAAGGPRKWALCHILVMPVSGRRCHVGSGPSPSHPPGPGGQQTESPPPDRLAWAGGWRRVPTVTVTIILAERTLACRNGCSGPRAGISRHGPRAGSPLKPKGSPNPADNFPIKKTRALCFGGEGVKESAV